MAEATTTAAGRAGPKVPPSARPRSPHGSGVGTFSPGCRRPWASRWRTWSECPLTAGSWSASMDPSRRGAPWTGPPARPSAGVPVSTSSTPGEPYSIYAETAYMDPAPFESAARRILDSRCRVARRARSCSGRRSAPTRDRRLGHRLGAGGGGVPPARRRVPGPRWIRRAAPGLGQPLVRRARVMPGRGHPGEVVKRQSWPDCGWRGWIGTIVRGASLGVRRGGTARRSSRRRQRL